MLDTHEWRVVASIATLIAAAVAGLIVHTLVFRLLRRFETGWEGSVMRHARGPLRALVPLIAIILVLPVADLPPSLELVLARGFGLAIIGCFGWLAIALLGVAEDVIAERYPTAVSDNLAARALRTRVAVLRSAGIVIIVVITASVILMSFPSVRQLGVSLLASAGLLALVVGMAARPALENLIAGLQIALTQPVRLDDVVVIEGEWGRIEEITLTYIVVRVWDSRRLILPLSYFISNPIENWTRRTSDLLGAVTVHTDYTVPVAEVREGLLGLLEKSSHWDGKVWSLQVTNTDANAVELRALMSARDSSEAWDLRCEIREGLVGMIQDRWPESLPRTRASVDWPRPETNGAVAHAT
ncbi:MAG: mechanosensitive ion channel family protein [Dehalococcoidia bacterium]